MFRLCLVLVILIAVNEKIVLGSFSDCYLEDGRAGTCMELEKCKVLSTAYDKCRLRPDKCDTGIEEAQVCCPNRPTVIKERPIDYSCNTNNYARRIIGMKVNNRTLYPHMAALGYVDPGSTRYAWRCGGTLIHVRYVLTAAHCLESPGPKAVLLGAYDLLDESDPYPQLIKVQSFLKYEGYNWNRYKDIGLVYLRRAIIETAYVSPACLLTTEIQNYGMLTTIGWGVGSDDKEQEKDEKGKDEKDEKMKKILREARMSLIKCRKHHEAVKFNKYIVCAGDTNDSACSGDSGGPLQVNLDERLYVMGVYSYGSGICDSRSYGRFIRLTQFLDWIERKVWTTERCMFKNKLPQ